MDSRFKHGDRVFINSSKYFTYKMLGIVVAVNLHNDDTCAVMMNFNGSTFYYTEQDLEFDNEISRLLYD